MSYSIPAEPTGSSNTTFQTTDMNMSRGHNDSLGLPLSRGSYLATGVYIMTVGVTGTIGNLLVIITVLKFWNRRNLHKKPHLPLILSLALSDLSITFFGYPYSSISGYAGRWMFTDRVCKMVGFSCFFLTMASLDALVAISIYRYIAICRPEKKTLLTSKNTVLVILACWVYALVWAAPPLLGLSEYTYEPFGTSCSMDWASRRLVDIIFLLGTDIFCFLLHVLILAFCYYKIYIRYKKLKQGSNARNGGPILSQEVRVTLVSLSLVVVFVIVWSPYAVVCTWQVFGDNVPASVTTLPTLFAKSSCAFNPILYGACDKNFRQIVKRIVCPWQFRQVEPTLDQNRYSPKLPKKSDLFVVGIAERNPSLPEGGVELSKNPPWSRKNSKVTQHKQVNEPKRPVQKDAEHKVCIEVRACDSCTDTSGLVVRLSEKANRAPEASSSMTDNEGVELVMPQTGMYVRPLTSDFVRPHTRASAGRPTIDTVQPQTAEPETGDYAGPTTSSTVGLQTGVCVGPQTGDSVGLPTSDKVWQQIGVCVGPHRGDSVGPPTTIKYRGNIRESCESAINITFSESSLTKSSRSKRTLGKRSFTLSSLFPTQIQEPFQNANKYKVMDREKAGKFEESRHGGALSGQFSDVLASGMPVVVDSSISERQPDNSSQIDTICTERRHLSLRGVGKYPMLSRRTHSQGSITLDKIMLRSYNLYQDL